MAESPACRQNWVTSSAKSPSTAVAFGRANAAAWPTSPCRFNPCSTSILSPSQSRASPPICRRCVTRIGSAISRRKSAGSRWAATSWSPCRGRRRTASRATSIFNCSKATGISSRGCSCRLSVACPRWKTPASANSSTGRKPSRRTAVSFLASRRKCAAFLSVPASTRTASRPTAGRGGRWRSGLSAASRRWICGRWTSGVLASITARRSSSSSARPRPPASITRWLGQARNTSPVGR